MDISNTLVLLARDGELCAWRERGIVIRVRAGLVIERVAVKTPYRWQPSYEDLIATDWMTGTQADFLKHFRPNPDQVDA